MTSSNPNHLQKVPSPNTIMLAVGVQHMNFGMNTVQSIAWASGCQGLGHGAQGRILNASGKLSPGPSTVQPWARRSAGEANT